MDFDITPLWERATRLGPGLRQPQLAEFTGLSVTAINRAVNHLQNLGLQDFRIVEHKVDVCEKIQKRAGVPINWKDVRAAKELIAAYETELRNPPAAPDQSDWILLSFVCQKDFTPEGVAANLGISLQELSARIAAASKKFEHSTREMAAWNADRAALTAIKNHQR